MPHLHAAKPRTVVSSVGAHVQPSPTHTTQMMTGLSRQKSSWRSGRSPSSALPILSSSCACPNTHELSLCRIVREAAASRKVAIRSLGSIKRDARHRPADAQQQPLCSAMSPASGCRSCRPMIGKYRLLTLRSLVIAHRQPDLGFVAPAEDRPTHPVRPSSFGTHPDRRRWRRHPATCAPRPCTAL